jgi:hypothetical protein
MQLQVFIDGVLNASTTDFELDRSVNCREDVKRCFEQRFSSAVVTVPPGMHTVEVAWSGKGAISLIRPELALPDY